MRHAEIVFSQCLDVAMVGLSDLPMLVGEDAISREIEGFPEAVPPATPLMGAGMWMYNRNRMGLPFDILCNTWVSIFLTENKCSTTWKLPLLISFFQSTISR